MRTLQSRGRTMKLGFMPVLNREHPLARGIVFSVPYIETGLYVNDVSGIAPAGFGGVVNATGIWNKKDPAVVKGHRGTTLFGGALFPAHSRFAIDQDSNFSIYHLGLMTATGPDNVWYQGVNDTNFNAPYWVLEYNLGNFQLDINDNIGGEQNFNSGSSTISPTSNNVVSLLAVRDRNRNEIRMYVNGKKTATLTDTTSASAWSTLGGPLKGAMFSDTYQGKRTLDILWKRALTDAEAFELHADPFTLFMPTPPRSWLFLTAFRDVALPIEWNETPSFTLARDVALPFETVTTIERTLELLIESDGIGSNSIGMSRDIHDRIYAPFLHSRDITNSVISGSLTMSRDITPRVTGASLSMSRNILARTGSTSVQSLFNNIIQLPIGEVTI